MAKYYGFGETKLARLVKPCQNTQGSLHLNAILLYDPGCYSEADLGCFERGVMRPKRARIPSGISEGERGQMSSEIFRAGEKERPREKHARAGPPTRNDANLCQMTEPLQIFSRGRNYYKIFLFARFDYTYCICYICRE